MLREDLSDWVHSVASKLGVRSPRLSLGSYFFEISQLTYPSKTQCHKVEQIEEKKITQGNFNFEGPTCKKPCQTILVLMNLRIKQGFRSCIFCVENTPLPLGQSVFAYRYGTSTVMEMRDRLLALPPWTWGAQGCQDHPVEKDAGSQGSRGRKDEGGKGACEFSGAFP